MKPRADDAMRPHSPRALASSHASPSVRDELHGGLAVAANLSRYALGIGVLLLVVRAAHGILPP